jgi:hypothetical protein
VSTHRTFENTSSARRRTKRKRTVKLCWNYAPGKVSIHVGRGREVIETIRQGLKEDEFAVSISKPWKWFEAPRRNVDRAEGQEVLLTPIKAMIEENR